VASPVFAAYPPITLGGPIEACRRRPRRHRGGDRIRRLLSAAPLKLRDRVGAHGRSRRYPPITLGGPIEAVGRSTGELRIVKYPPITLGGPIEASRKRRAC